MRNRRQAHMRVVDKSSFVQINSVSCFQRCGPESSSLDSKLFQNKPTLINVYLQWVGILLDIIEIRQTTVRVTRGAVNRAEDFKGEKGLICLELRGNCVERVQFENKL